MVKKPKATSVEEYISGFPNDVQQKLKQMRELILDAVPNAEESISYAMPAYKFNKKPLVYFAGYDHHIGFYATPTGHEKFKNVLAGYKQGKGSVQFPLDAPLPTKLITSIVNFNKEKLEKL